MNYRLIWFAGGVLVGLNVASLVMN